MNKQGKIYNMMFEILFFCLNACMHVQELENEHCTHIANLLKQIHRKTHLYKEDDVISHHNLVVVLHAGESGTDLGFIKRWWAALVDALH